MYTILHGLLDIPQDAVLAGPPTLDFRVMLSKFTNNCAKPVTANLRPAFE